MSFIESVLVALFCMAVVFVVLGMLWAILRLFSSAVRLLESRNHSADTDS